MHKARIFNYAKYSWDRYAKNSFILLLGTLTLIIAKTPKIQGQKLNDLVRDRAVDSLPSKDSISAHHLATVTITAFQGSGAGTDIAASIFPLDKGALQLLDNSSLLSAFNAAPGVRLEQRSPGSLRFSIRGSLLRSPYGVRGVKFYMDGIPLTDAGGNTYLQSISPAQLQSAEIIKGPVGSLYGAGTGGAVLLHTPGDFTDTLKNSYHLAYDGGSFGRIHPQVSWLHTSAKSYTNLSGSYFYSKGNRQQDTSHHTVLHYNATYKLTNKLQLKLLGFYSDLYYQTPGGLTQRQWGTDTTAYPLAIQQKAAVFNRSLFVGGVLSTKINPFINNQTALVFSHTGFKNPFTSNFEKRREFNYGGRSVFTFQRPNSQTGWQLLTGIEWMGGNDHINNYDNLRGVPGGLQYKDQLMLQKHSIFMQYSMDLDPKKKWHLQAGLSTHGQRLSYKRLSDSSFGQNKIARTHNQWSPKLGLTYKILPAVAVFASAAKGFSTPTLAEIHPSDGRFDQSLQAESGWNLETGIKGTAANTKVRFQASIYRFSLNHAIVRQVDAHNVEYYINAGKTSQAGAELYLRYALLSAEQLPAKRYIQQILLKGSYSYQPYHFMDYQLADHNYNGHPLTGVPKNTAVLSLNIRTETGIYLHAMVNHTSRIPLNDASTVYADAYTLCQAKLGYRWTMGSIKLNLYFGLDNLFNQRYSLGSDINAYGGRYFNPAPGRNFYVGCGLQF